MSGFEKTPYRESRVNCYDYENMVPLPLQFVQWIEVRVDFEDDKFTADGERIRRSITPSDNVINYRLKGFLEQLERNDKCVSYAVSSLPAVQCLLRREIDNFPKLSGAIDYSMDQVEEDATMSMGMMG